MSVKRKLNRGKAVWSIKPTVGIGRFIAIRRGLSARHSSFAMVSKVIALAPNSPLAILKAHQYVILIIMSDLTQFN